MAISANQQALSEWYQSPLGRNILHAEQKCVQEMLSHCFGYYLLQMGDEALANFAEASFVANKYYFCYNEPALKINPNKLVIGDIQTLPFLPNSVDVIILPHVLEFVENPEGLLEQLWEILVPGGYLIALSFNPWSIWGIYRALGDDKQAPYCGHYYSLQQLRKMLLNKSFLIEEIRKCDFTLPFKKEVSNFEQKLWLVLSQIAWPNFANVNIIQAKKQIHCFTPIKPNWQLISSKTRIINTSS